MKNYKNIGWIEGMPDQMDKKINFLNLISLSKK